ncbi:MAG: RNA-binding protein [Gammaproteobacteria bacterium]|nr:MAG: RNA-binding protein [Gammaproteobacteria bacterium]
MKLTSIIILIVCAITGYFIAPHIGLAANDLTIGIIAGGILQTLLILVSGSSISYSSEASADNSEKKTVYVGNLDFDTTEEAISALFETYGEISTVRLMRDKETGKGRGFCFVEMGAANAQVAIDALNGSDFAGRTLKVNVANNRRNYNNTRRRYSHR